MSETENLPVPRGAVKVNKTLVKEASNKIQSILREHLGAASYEVVDYLMEAFFNNEKENLKKKKLVGHKSFQQLLISIQDLTGKSQSWLYEAIKLWLDREKMQGCEAYMKLSISHRALLLKTSDVDEKKKLAEKFIQEKTSYKKAKDELLGSSPNTDFSVLSRLINHSEKFKDDELEEDEFSKMAKKSFLKKRFHDLSPYLRNAIIIKAEERILKLENQINSTRTTLNDIKGIKSHLDTLKNDPYRSSGELIPD